MKIDMKQLMGPEWESKKGSPPKVLKKSGRLMKGVSVFALCMVVIAAFTIYHQISLKDSASADTPYNELETNPSFVVQHMSTIKIPYIQEGDGKIPTLLKDEGIWHTTLEKGLLKTKEKQTELYKEYKTNWNKTNTIADVSFLNSKDGKATAGYDLKEIWFGNKKDSTNVSDFIILSVPHTDGAADLSKITLTNNPNHPGLSGNKDGHYISDKHGNYTICVQNGNVIRLVFQLSSTSESNPVNLYDYDISDGGYYVNNDYYHKGAKQATSRQSKRSGTIYVNAIENGIHQKSNYSGNGAKLAFGGTSIGTELGDEVRDNALDTINVHNVMNTKTTGVSLGLTTGITTDGNIKWADNISAPDLFSKSNVVGQTSYINSEYAMTFTREGFTHTLSSVKSTNETVAKNLETIDKNFWIADTVPSYGADGHDVVWGNGSKKVKYYRAGDKSPKAFEPSNDKQNHNSFFGFAYAEDFTLSPGYTGPLDIFGYSDDDLWAYVARIDKDGNIIENTAVPVIDLGGVHEGTGYYTNLWDVIDPVAYEKEEQQWRLFVFWLERDGTSAKCYMRFTLPDAAIVNEKETGSVDIEAVDFASGNKKDRTFIFDDGTNNRYKMILQNKKAITITSGEEFLLPTKSTATITGLSKDKAFAIKETKKPYVWSSSGDSYNDSNTVTCIVGKNNRVCFVSVENKGHITIGAKAKETPDNGYLFTITLDELPKSGVLAIDAQGNPHSYLQMNKNKSCTIAIGAGDTLSLYNLPENVDFSVTADEIEGHHVTGISIDGNLRTSGRMVSGSADASVIYQYERDSKVKSNIIPQIVMEQSVSGDWEKTDVILKDGMPISYNVTVTNPGNKTMNLSVKDTVPNDLEIIESTISNDGALVDGMIKWNTDVKAKSSVKLSFTGTVSTKNTNMFINSAQALVNGKTVAKSNTVKAIVK